MTDDLRYFHHRHHHHQQNKNERNNDSMVLSTVRTSGPRCSKYRLRAEAVLQLLLGESYIPDRHRHPVATASNSQLKKKTINNNKRQTHRYTRREKLYIKNRLYKPLPEFTGSLPTVKCTLRSISARLGTHATPHNFLVFVVERLECLSNEDGKTTQRGHGRRVGRYR